MGLSSICSLTAFKGGIPRGLPTRHPHKAPKIAKVTPKKTAEREAAKKFFWAYISLNAEVVTPCIYIGDIPYIYTTHIIAARE